MTAHGEEQKAPRLVAGEQGSPSYPDPKWVEAAIAEWKATWTRYTVAPGVNDERIIMLRLTDVLTAVEPLIREQIATAIEAVDMGCPFDNCQCSGARMQRDAAAIARGGAW